MQGQQEIDPDVARVMMLLRHGGWNPDAFGSEWVEPEHRSAYREALYRQSVMDPGESMTAARPLGMDVAEGMQPFATHLYNSPYMMATIDPWNVENERRNWERNRRNPSVLDTTMGSWLMRGRGY